jgi:hypothetical protein
MPDMSSDQIRDIAVRCVEGFFNDKVSLSEGLAKEASAHELNLEQIKRAAEVTNTVCQLKLMQLSEDKTVEFPLCKVAEVMASMCVPDEGMAKSASAVETPVAATPEQYVASEMSEHERTLHFIKEAAVNAQALSQLEDRAIVLQSQLVKIASEVKADPKWLDKMSSIDTDTFAELSVLISGSVAAKRDFGGHSMFKEAELSQVKGIAALYKEARAIVAEVAQRKSMHKRAEDLTAGMTKEAFFGGVAGAMLHAPDLLAKGAKSGATAVKNLSPAGVAGAVGKGIGSTVGAAGNLTGRAVGKVASGVGGMVANAGKTMVGVRKATVGQKVGAAVALDVGYHLSSGGTQPHSDGSTRDVWQSLQN